MAITGSKFSNLTAQQKADMRDAIRGYKVISALLVDAWPDDTFTSGTFKIGRKYLIINYIEGDDFSNIANVISGTINTTGCVFIATGTTPNVFNNNSTIIDTGGPVIIYLENTIGELSVEYQEPGYYYLHSVPSGGVFLDGKTVVFGSFANVTTQVQMICDSEAISINCTQYGEPADNCLDYSCIEIRVYP